LINRFKQGGWRVELVYLALPNVEMSKLRVAERVAHGGHAIPDAAIERRFARSLRNLFVLYVPLADRTRCLLNSDEVPAPVFVQRGDEREILDAGVFAYLQREAGL
jgi:predicted ABC-type ATPase